MTMSYQKRTKDQLAARVAQDIPEGAVVNLGIGQPTLVANHIPKEREVLLHSENGLLGMGPAPAPGQEDYDLINAGKQPVTLLPGGSFFHHTDSFAMMRVGAKQTWVMMDLLTKQGESKVVKSCSYPLTGIACVKRIYADLCTLECTPQGLKLIDLVDGLTHAELEKMIGLPIAH
ncbi:MAG: 3-oxoadipate CoA-transferase [Curvibacter sp. GWA2_64_110]|nr:MAG: 3-oxoadipate CoA-transferase [Curvibacter sp. GWA2_64_110]